MLNPGVIALIIPVIIFMIPIIAILTHHQRKMAELTHSRWQGQSNTDIERLNREVQELKQLVHQQAILIDNLVSTQTQLHAPQDQNQLRGRIG